MALKKLSNIFICFFIINMPLSCSAQADNGWTIMYYAVGSNSSETDLLSDIGEMMKGKTSDGYELITLIDRTKGYSDDGITLGENFIDTRLYKLYNNKYQELDGGDFLPEIRTNTSADLNMADAHVLKRFIQYCKANYPARHYMLVFRSHGNGVGMCPDAESGTFDKLYPGELRDVLSEEESVDILGLDVCSMAGLENFYEWRPGDDLFSADYILASAPLSAAWDYDDIFNRLQTEKNKYTTIGSNHFIGGPEFSLNPSTMTPLEFSKLIIEEIYDSQQWASWGLFDNTVIVDLKLKIDILGQLLYTEDKKIVISIIEETLGYYHNTGDDIEIAQLTFPYIDAYDFYSHISLNPQINPSTREIASEVLELIDKLVVHSYYGSGYLPANDNFADGKNGVYQVIPLGNRVFTKTNRIFWAHTDWFHPDDKRSDSRSYGLYDWCSDGATAGNGKVENFYEYLDYLFDTSNTKTGGVNGYQW